MQQKAKLPNQSLKRDVQTADAPRVLIVEHSNYNLRYNKSAKLNNIYNALERLPAA
jgi:hypothetical protein